MSKQRPRPTIDEIRNRWKPLARQWKFRRRNDGEHPWYEIEIGPGWWRQLLIPGARNEEWTEESRAEALADLSSFAETMSRAGEDIAALLAEIDDLRHRFGQTTQELADLRRRDPWGFED